MDNEFGHPEWLDFPRVGNGKAITTPGGSGTSWTTTTSSTGEDRSKGRHLEHNLMALQVSESV